MGISMIINIILLIKNIHRSFYINQYLLIQHIVDIGFAENITIIFLKTEI